MTRHTTRLERAIEVDASLSNRSPLPLAAFSQAGISPFAQRAQGPYVWTEDGHRLTDYVLGFGSVILGHADPEVTRAVTDELTADLAPSLLGRKQLELCELLVDVVPGAEQALLCRTGSDATDLAVRLARAYTRRSHVISFGYHGWHDWCAPRGAGVLNHRRDLSEIDLDGVPAALRRLERVRSDLACVLVMPYELDPPNRETLCHLQAFAKSAGALFILDEVRSGFRVALGGAQEYCSLTADLAIFSKAMANGYAIAAMTGSRPIMQHMRTLSASSYAFRHTEAMAAAVATIGALRDRAALGDLWSRGEQFLSGLEVLARSAPIPARVRGLPPTPFLELDCDDLTRERFVAEALRRGVLVLANHHWFISAAHSAADVAATLDVVAAALSAAARQ